MTEESNKQQPQPKAAGAQDATEAAAATDKQQADQKEQPHKVKSEDAPEYNTAAESDASDGLEQEADDMLQFDQPTTASAVKRSSSKQQASQPAATKVSISKLAIVALLIAAASGAANYWLYQQTLERNDIVSQLQAKVTTRSEQFQQLQTRLDAQQSTHTEALAALEQKIAQQQQQQQLLQQNIQLIAGKSQNEWALAEADYLLQLAVKRLQFEQDVTTALALLLSADQALAAAADNDLLALRDSIAKDIGKLNAVAQSDSNQILLSLETLMAMVPELPLANLTSDTLPKPIEVEAGAQQKDWWDKIIEVITPAVRIQKHDRPLEPLLSPSEHANLRHNMILALQQAQMAALRKQQTLYTQQLDKVTTWFKQYFKTQPENSARFEALLNELTEKKVSSPIPKLTSPALARSQLTNNLQSLLNNKAQQVQQQEHPQEQES